MISAVQVPFLCCWAIDSYASLSFPSSASSGESFATTCTESRLVGFDVPEDWLWDAGFCACPTAHRSSIQQGSARRLCSQSKCKQVHKRPDHLIGGTAGKSDKTPPCKRRVGMYDFASMCRLASTTKVDQCLPRKYAIARATATIATAVATKRTKSPRGRSRPPALSSMTMK